MKDGAIYLFGNTGSSSGIASVGGHQTEFSYNPNSTTEDWYMVKFTECESLIDAEVTEFLCVGEDIILEASGGISYLWSGPNGFSSTEPNPVVENAAIGDSGIYSVFIVSDAGCEETLDLDVLVSERPIANPIENIESCEDIYGSGISSSIDTSSVIAQVLGDQTNMTIRYFDGNGMELPSPLPYPLTNTIPNQETITVQVSNTGNLECYAETTFDIIIHPIPNVIAIKDIYTCDEDNDGFSFFDLSGLENIVLDNQNNVEFTLYRSNGDPINLSTTQIVANKVPNEEVLTARVTNNLTQCYNETSFRLITHPTPVTNTIEILYGCDDDDDGISEYFDTSSIEEQVLNGQSGMQVTYYFEDGVELPEPLPNPLTNTLPYDQSIQVRVTNLETGCNSETTLHLRTVSQPLIEQPENIYACDLGNGYAYFDTSQLREQIIGRQSGLILKYFDENNQELPSPLPEQFQNTVHSSKPFSLGFKMN